jgi:hypothetical protein
MEMLNNAFEGADAFRKMLEKCEAKQEPVTKGQNFENRSGTAENRAERRARERAEKNANYRLQRKLKEFV